MWEEVKKHISSKINVDSQVYRYTNKFTLYIKVNDK